MHLGHTQCCFDVGPTSKMTQFRINQMNLQLFVFLALVPSEACLRHFTERNFKIRKYFVKYVC